MTLVTALAAPVEDGMMLPDAHRPPRQSLLEDASTTFWVAVMAWTVVMRPSSMPNLSLMALTMGARPLVVQDAQETATMDGSWVSAVRKAPVDSQMYSAPIAPKGISD